MSSTHFPAVGHVYEVDFGNWVHHLRFESEAAMSITNVDGPFKGDSETVQIVVTLIRQNIFMISWQEEDQTTVVHVEDYENGIVHTHVTKPGGAFIRRSGTLKKIE